MNWIVLIEYKLIIVRVQRIYALESLMQRVYLDEIAYLYYNYTSLLLW